MAIKREETKEIVVVMSGIKSSSDDKWALICDYRAKGISGIGSHYVIHANGDVTKGRPSDEHGNVMPLFNKKGVFIELMGVTSSDITKAQRAVLKATTEFLETKYVEAEVLDLTN